MSAPQPLEEGPRWLAQAEEDLRAAEFTVRGRFFAQTCFMAQQAAEKAAKAVHYARGERVVHGHSVFGLLGALSTPFPPEVVDAAKILDQYYIPTRYPNGLPEGAGTPSDHYTEAQATMAIAQARAIIDAARTMLSKEARAGLRAPGLEA